MDISSQISSFGYLGSKFSVLPWLLPLLPECYHFVDVFGGSGVVLMNRKPSPIETLNDKNDKVFNFFQVLRTQPDELMQVLEFTLHSRKEYDEAWYVETDTPLEKARKFFVRTQQSLWSAGAQDKAKGWACAISQSRVSISEKTQKWLRSIEGLPEIVNRLKNVQIECRDFRYVLKNYDSEGTLFYLDSPYDMTHRSSTMYEMDFVNQDFYDLLYWVRKLKGKFALSGYDSPFMHELFGEFNFHKGPQRKNSRSIKEACECLWTNY